MIMKNLIKILLIFVAVPVFGQNVENYRVDIELDELKLNGSISIETINKINQSAEPLLDRLPGIASSEKMDYDLWTFNINDDKLIYEFTQKGSGPDEWELTLLELTSPGSSLTIRNVNFKIGDDISKLSSLFPIAYQRRGKNPHDNTYCAVLQIDDLIGGIALVYNVSTQKITQIEFSRLLH